MLVITTIIPSLKVSSIFGHFFTYVLADMMNKINVCNICTN